jgi:flagellar biosynthesis GTPase FlhF
MAKTAEQLVTEFTKYHKDFKPMPIGPKPAETLARGMIEYDNEKFPFVKDTVALIRAGTSNPSVVAFFGKTIADGFASLATADARARAISTYGQERRTSQLEIVTAMARAPNDFMRILDIGNIFSGIAVAAAKKSEVTPEKTPEQIAAEKKAVEESEAKKKAEAEKKIADEKFAKAKEEVERARKEKTTEESKKKTEALAKAKEAAEQAQKEQAEQAKAQAQKEAQKKAQAAQSASSQVTAPLAPAVPVKPKTEPIPAPVPVLTPSATAQTPIKQGSGALDKSMQDFVDSLKIVLDYMIGTVGKLETEMATGILSKAVLANSTRGQDPKYSTYTLAKYMEEKLNLSAQFERLRNVNTNLDKTGITTDVASVILSALRIIHPAVVFRHIHLGESANVNTAVDVIDKGAKVSTSVTDYDAELKTFEKDLATCSTDPPGQAIHAEFHKNVAPIFEVIGAVLTSTTIDSKVHGSGYSASHVVEPSDIIPVMFST